MTWSIGVNTGDPQFVMWCLSWPSFAISHGASVFFTNYQYYPAGVNLMWNGQMLLPALVLSPITWFGGPVLSYNVLATAALALSAWTAFLFIGRFVSSQVAAAVGGLLYGFSPYMTAHSLGHPVLTAAFMPPLLLLLLDDIVRVQRRPPIVSGLLLGLVGVAQLLTGEELLATTAFLATLMICLALAMWWGQIKPKLKHAFQGLAVAALVFGVLAAGPIAFQLLGPRGFHGVVHPSNSYVSDLLSFFVPTRMLLLAPGGAVTLSDRFVGGVVEINSYVGVPLVALLVFVAVRYWHEPVVRLAALTAVLIAILSMGVTIHFAGGAGMMPVFVVGIAFPLLQRFLPGRMMLYLTFLGWLALSRIPVFDNILPTRLMVYFYLLAGLLLAVFLDNVMAWRSWLPAVGAIAVALALIPLIPILPYRSSPEPVPSYFTGTAVSRIPAGSVALVVPLSLNNDGRAMLWQASAQMRFRMPEGYAIIPEIVPPKSRLSAKVLDVAYGEPVALSDSDRLLMLTELFDWRVKTVIVGPMVNEQSEIQLFTSLLNQEPQQSDGVYIWSGVDAETLSDSNKASLSTLGYQSPPPERNQLQDVGTAQTLGGPRRNGKKGHAEVSVVSVRALNEPVDQTNLWMWSVKQMFAQE
jgi:hypothetical protein